MTNKTYTVQEKVKLFVSSGMSSKSLKATRNAIHDLLNDSPYVQGWLFEHAGASSFGAEADYRLRVADADVCAFIIDGRFEIPVGVQKELDEASRRNKKCFYYFYRISHEEPRRLRDGLRGPDGPHYCEVNRISDIPGLIQKDVVEEIFFAYRSYAHGYATMAVDGMSPSSMPMAQDIFVSRSSLSGYPACEAVLNRFLYDSSAKPEAAVGLDGAMASFLNVMLRNTPITGFRVSQMLSELKKRLPDAYYPTIELRWRAIQQFYLGDLNEALEIEKRAMASAKEANLPTWFIDDVLIDLRNLEAETDRRQNIIYRQSSYQDEINNQNREIQLPLVDRITSDLLESIAAEELKKRVQSAYTITFGTPTSKWTGMLVKLLAAVVHYGSLTHIRLFNKRMRLVVSCLWQITGNRANIMAELKLALVTSSAKDLQGFIGNNGSLYGEMTCDEADSAFSFAWNAAFGCSRDETRVMAFATLAAFLSDATYVNATKEVKALCNKLLANEVAPPRQLHRMLSECYSRSGDEWVIDVVIAALEKGPRTYWASEAFSFLSDVNPERLALDDVRSQELLRSLEPHVVDEGADKGDVINAISGLPSLSVQQADWFTAFEEGLSEYQRAKLMVWLNIHDDAIVERLLEESLASIREDNSAQGAGGQWSYGAVNQYGRIEVLLKEATSPRPSFAGECALASAETLVAPKQTMRAKWAACLLLLFLISRDSGLLHNESLLKMLEDVDEGLFAHLPFGLLGEHGDGAVRIALKAIRDLFGIPQDETLRLALLDEYRSETDGLANNCVLLRYLVCESMWEIVPDDVVSNAVDYLLVMANHETSLVRRNALLALSPLTMHPEYCRSVCAAFTRVFESSHPSSKHAILNALRDGGAFLPEEKAHILQAASATACVYVRRRVDGGELVS